jgi:hypothetical protein
MGLIDELESEVWTGSTRCKLGRFLDTIEPKDAAEIERIFAECLYPVEVVARVLVKRGYDGGITVIRRHARKDCACQSKMN